MPTTRPLLRYLTALLALWIVAWPAAAAINYDKLLAPSNATAAQHAFVRATGESLIAKGLAEKQVEEIIRTGVSRGLPVRSIVRMLFVAADLDIPGKVPARVEVDLLPPFQLSAEDAARMMPAIPPPTPFLTAALLDPDTLPGHDFKQGYFTTPFGNHHPSGIRNRFQDLPFIDIHWGWAPALPHLPIVTPDIPFIRTPAYSIASFIYSNLPDVPLVDLKMGRFLTPDVPYVDVNIPLADKGGEFLGIPWPRPDIPFIKFDPPLVELNTWLFGRPILTPDIPFIDLKTPLDNVIGFIKRL